MNGPIDKGGYTWWGVHWLDRNVWGWSVERYLQSTSGGGSGSADLVWPMSGYITSPYGQRSSGFHNGVDIGHNGVIGTPIYAARGGTAYTAYDAGGLRELRLHQPRERLPDRVRPRQQLRHLGRSAGQPRSAYRRDGRGRQRDRPARPLRNSERQ